VERRLERLERLAFLVAGLAELPDAPFQVLAAAFKTALNLVPFGMLLRVAMTCLIHGECLAIYIITRK